MNKKLCGHESLAGGAVVNLGEGISGEVADDGVEFG